MIDVISFNMKTYKQIEQRVSEAIEDRNIMTVYYGRVACSEDNPMISLKDAKQFIKTHLKQALLDFYEEVEKVIPSQKKYESLGSPDEQDFIARHNYNLAISDVADNLKNLKQSLF